MTPSQSWFREAPWSSGERRGLTIQVQAMFLGRGFESRLHLKTRWNDGPLDSRKIMKDNKDSQMGQVTPKTYLKKKYSAYCTG